MTMIESKVVNIEKAPGKIVPTLVNAKDHPEYFVKEEKKVVEVVVEEVVEKPKKASPKKKAAPKKKVTK